MPTAVVTGISGNLGLAVANRLLADGYRVAGSYGSRKPAGVGDDSRCSLHQADLADEAAAVQFVQDCIGELSTIDVAVLTVGAFEMGDLVSTDKAMLEKMIRLNFYTAYNTARLVFAAMKKAGHGRIFLVGSLAGENTSKGKSTVAYALSKSLLDGLARLLNAEAGDSDIVSSLVIPSTIDTPENRKAMPGADTADWVSPETIAGVIAWYAGPEAQRLRQPLIYVTGKSV